MFDAEDEKVPQAEFSQAPQQGPEPQELPLPPNFLWGPATAAYQIEGGFDQDGKGQSIWDVFSHLEPSRTRGDNGDVACDHYNRMQEDVDLMASFGIDVYRFSISWARLIPLGGRDDPVNEKGIEFYNKLIDALLARGIQPVVTLYHWDLPQELYTRYQGFLNTEQFVADFQNFARLCFSRFGDRVKKWITFNEPWVICIFGHLMGTVAPGRRKEDGNDTTTEPWRAGHSIILAHTAAVRTYATEFQRDQRGEISIVLNGHFFEPYDSSSEADVAAAQRRLEFFLGWFGDPIYLGTDYPASMRKQLGSRLPKFTAEELALLRWARPLLSTFGLNHYTTKYARALPGEPRDDDHTGNVEELAVNIEGKEIGPLSGIRWLRLTPGGIRKILNWIWDRYHVPIVITENGCVCPGEDKMTAEQAVDDAFRIRYFGLYLDSISRAIYEDGVRVEGYYAWSLMDNFGKFNYILPIPSGFLAYGVLEWSHGYAPRFGIVYTNYETLERTPKKSAYYLRDTFQKRRKA